MDILWQRQKYLHVILRTLPARCWIFTDRGYVSVDVSRSSMPLILPLLQCVIRAPTTDEWERFRRYTARVVELYIGGWRFAEVTPETTSFFGVRSTLDPLWPKLTSLRLTDGLCWAAIPSALTFLSSRITTLTLTLPRDDNILLQPILSIATDRCRWLQELVLDVVTLDSDSTNAVRGLIIACRNTLHTLDIRSSFKGVYLPIIANLPRLRNLRLWAAHNSCDLPSNAFPSLEEVIILRFRGQRVQHFFERLCTTSLKAVKIHGTDVICFGESIAALSRFSASLEVLEISGVENLNLPSHVVPPLLFTSLRTLYVGCLLWGDGAHHGPCVFEPTDQAIAGLGAAVPNITHLTLGSPTCPNLKCVTFLSLVSLSKTCRDLETLMIRVNFRSMVVPSLCWSEGFQTGATFDGPQGSGCKLRKLVVGLSTLPNHTDSGWVVAIGLGKIFPSLSEVVGLDQDDWDIVRRNIGTLRLVLHTVR